MGTRTANFVCIRFTEETDEKLRNYCEQNGFDLTKSFSGTSQSAKNFKFHTTVFYSEVGSKNFSTRKYNIEPFKVSPLKFALFGDSNDVPVLKLERNFRLTSLYNYYGDVFGLESDYPTFNPHVSLSYNYNQSKEFLLATKLPDFDIIVDRVEQYAKG
ncbi:RNA 2',3'-cyclic phosphodiesterase/2'-5' RNA ligase [Ochrobactrum phage vB_OspM_OC]|nr:RNA 2',3'-cyclic phosphodiesterase/2'-5' RNA ligase [Ochrobactrum phage vB_OspM_OC]